MKAKERLKKAMFSYTMDSNGSEEENNLLRETVNQLKNELEKFRSPALLIGELVDLQGDKAIIRLPNGNDFLVEMSNTAKDLKAGDSVLLEQKNLIVIEKIHLSKRFNVEQFVILEKPNISWKDIGGLREQVEDIQEVIELPLKKPELFKEVGIQPPKGILLYGPPGSGKTLLAKAVAASTNSTFIEIVGSELVQKFIGEGAKMVKEIFNLARAKAPSIVFIDEIDALASKRIDVGTSGEREVQRTFMQFLAEIDGFKPLDNVKIIGCTNRHDILDPAIIRPGRLDRLIEVPNPDEEGLKEIFKIHTKRMTLDKKIDLDRVLKNMKEFSGAEIKAVCTEAGYFAIRNNRTKIIEDDLLKAIKKVKKEEERLGTKFLKMYG